MIPIDMRIIAITSPLKEPLVETTLVKIDSVVLDTMKPNPLSAVVAPHKILPLIS